MSKLTVKDIDLNGKRVIERVDFNVPLDEKGNIADDFRITAALKTIKYILEKGAKKLILISHLGRPEGKVIESLRMNPIAKRLSELLALDVEKLDDCVGEEVRNALEKSECKIILLENLRFHPEEKNGDRDFAKELAGLADVYVNDAFGTAHRAHASTATISEFLPSCMGFLMEKEEFYLSKLTFNPEKPFVVILGGVKVLDKINAVRNLLPKVDRILIGGSIAYTFLKSMGKCIGSSKTEENKIGLATKISKDSRNTQVKIILPVDNLVVRDLEKPETMKNTDKIPQGYKGVDIGPKTIEFYKRELRDAKTVLWNGPLGIFEKLEYSNGTREIAKFLSTLSAIVVVAGGHSAAAAKKFGVKEKLSHVSTGGGATLAYLEGRSLPGIEAISEWTKQGSKTHAPIVFKIHRPIDRLFNSV